MGHVSLVTLGVADVDRATRFYEHLGWRISPASVPGEVSFLVGGTVVLALWGREELAADANAPDATSALALNLASTEDVDAVLAEASDAGAEVVTPARTTDWDGYSGYLRDPDGHLWEVAHNPHWRLDDDGRLWPPGAVDEEAHERNRAEIRGFIERTDGAGDPSAGALADAVVAILEDTWRHVAAVVGAQPNDKVIATMLELSDRAQQVGDPTDDRQWVLHAASTLVSGMIPAARSEAVDG